jgi:hypothetical protein
MHQSDRGAQYASHADRGLLADHGIVCRAERGSARTMR